jgi:hypothetical protein
MEGLDGKLDVPDGLRLREAVEVQVASRDGREIERPEERHQRADEEFAAARSHRALMVPKAPLDCGRDTPVHDARTIRRSLLGVLHGLEIETHLGHPIDERHRAEVAPFGSQRGDVLEPVGVRACLPGTWPRKRSSGT